MKEPSLKNMLLAQINRLDKSNDLLDKQLRSYLINIVKDKSNRQEGWIAEIEEVEHIHRLVKNGKSVDSAVDIVATKSKRRRSALQEKYAEYKDALDEIDQIFPEFRT